MEKKIIVNENDLGKLKDANGDVLVLGEGKIGEALPIKHVENVVLGKNDVIETGRILTEDELKEVSNMGETVRSELIEQDRIPGLIADYPLDLDEDTSVVAENAAGVHSVVPEAEFGRVFDSADSLLEEDIFSNKLMVAPEFIEKFTSVYNLTGEQVKGFNARAIALHHKMLKNKDIISEGNVTIILKPENVTLDIASSLLGIDVITSIRNIMDTSDNIVDKLEDAEMRNILLNTLFRISANFKKSDRLPEVLNKSLELLGIEVNEENYARIHKFIEFENIDSKDEAIVGKLNSVAIKYIKENSITAKQLDTFCNTATRGFVDDETYLNNTIVAIAKTAIYSTAYHEQDIVNIQESMNQIMAKFQKDTDMNSDQIVEKMDEYFLAAATKSKDPKKMQRAKDIVKGIDDSETLSGLNIFQMRHVVTYNRNIVRAKKSKVKKLYDKEANKLYDRLDSVKYTFDNPYTLIDKLVDMLDEKYAKADYARKFLIILFKYINVTGFNGYAKGEMNISMIFFTSRLFRYIMTYETLSDSRKLSVKTGIQKVMKDAGIL